MTELQVTTSTGAYPIIIDSGCFSQISDRLNQSSGHSKICVVVDAEVERIYHAEIESNFKNTSLDVCYHIIPSGESSKNIEKYTRLIEFLNENKINRNDFIIALGGGVVSDIAGFAAATYMRGLKWSIIPTTLLAQSDASIGGKTAIHLAGVKNLIGAFHQPSLVLIDPEFLKTLSLRNYLCGLAEIMKMAILPGNENFSILNSDFRTELFSDESPTGNVIANIKMIEESCRYKAKIVEQDEFDYAGRIALNLGHTLGHALEAALRFDGFTHGEAVCIGTLFISWISFNRNHMPENDFEEILELFKPVALSIPIDVFDNAIDLEWNILHDLINHDKKRTDEIVRWIYPLGIGKIKIEELDLKHFNYTWTEFKEALVGWCKDGR